MTTLSLGRKGRDPRLDLTPDELTHASVRAEPRVGKAAAGVDLGMLAGGAGALALGALTLVAMSGRQPSKAEPVTPAETPVATQADQPAAPAVVRAQAAPPPPLQSAATGTPATAVDPNQSRAQPLIIDNTDGLAAHGPAKPVDAGEAKTNVGALSADEQFSLRVGGDSGPAHGESLGDPARTVVQGTMIPAVLETALNSDLPGYARAIVSRDVKGFDGSGVVIPRGSRLIGQYKSGLASGQSRAFVVWSRLIRPDGVSIALGSPVMDESGQTGLAGKVDRHFLQRFGGAMLLSVVSALPSALIGGGSTALVINSGSDATGAASQAVQSDARIAPTIRVPLGTPIQVFAARDLVFEGR
jgi:type IV secretion system protein VirB10